MCRVCPIRGPPWGPSQDSEGLRERQVRSLGGGGVSFGAAGFSRYGGHTFTKVGAMPRKESVNGLGLLD